MLTSKGASGVTGAGFITLAATLAQAASPCMLVFGQGRNPPQEGAPDWDDLNRRFNTAVADTLDACQGADGLQALQWLALEAGTPLKHNLRVMLQEHMGAQRLRTRQVLVELQRYPAWRSQAAAVSLPGLDDGQAGHPSAPFPESEER